jgi:hypothetical protein
MSSNEIEPESQSSTPRCDFPCCLQGIVIMMVHEELKMSHKQKQHRFFSSILSIPITENNVVAVSKKIIRADAKNPQWSRKFSI